MREFGPMSAPATIAHYKITSKLGEGGMGAVYRATDTKLNREVAIKVLPDSFAADPDRLARFTREARVLASLNHPNIAAIYGVEERALIMELVEGPTLAERIAQGALPLDEALAVVRAVPPPRPERRRRPGRRAARTAPSKRAEARPRAAGNTHSSNGLEFG